MTRRRPPSLIWESISSRTIVIFLAVAGIVAPLIYYLLAGGDGILANLVTEVAGLGLGFVLGYLIIDKKISEDRRKVMRAVEHDVLDGILAYSISLARVIAMYCGHSEFQVERGENDARVIAVLDEFVKSAVKNGIEVPVHDTVVNVRFSSLVQDITRNMYELQTSYPFVFQEYHDISNMLLQLRVRMTSLSDTFYWQRFGEQGQDMIHVQSISRVLQRLLALIDSIAEETSRHLERLRQRR